MCGETKDSFSMQMTHLRQINCPDVFFYAVELENNLYIYIDIYACMYPYVCFRSNLQII